MLIAGEPSGDLLAAELARALRREQDGNASFFGAGGPNMAAAGVELAFDLTRHAVVGLVEVLKRYGAIKRLFDALVALALQRRPETIVCVDFGGFNRRFARRIRWEIEVQRPAGWRPRIVQYVSPQVWASRPGRARAMARDFDLVLAIFAFEKAWYAQRVPSLNVEFVGHPLLDRHAAACTPAAAPGTDDDEPLLLLLPGSRVGELTRHLPVMLGAFERVQAAQPGARGLLVVPDEPLARLARSFPAPARLEIQTGPVSDALRRATIAIASTGTVTLECALFRVPTVALYKTSWSTYQIGRRIIQVKYLAMPNILADQPLFPEFIQQQATPENIGRAALALLADGARRRAIQERLGQLVATLGGPGASTRAAKAILQLERR